MDSQGADVKQLARAVDERVMRPVRKLLGGTKRVFLSPDGALNLVPFAALVDEQNRYLVESYSFTYLTSGRDLLRLQVHAENKSNPVVIANPLFEEGEKSAVAQTQTVEQAIDALRSRRSINFTSMTFSPLPGTAGEAVGINAVLPKALLLTQAKATESALKGVSGPLILHIATHGFFLPDRSQPDSERNNVGFNAGDAAERPTARAENPLLRSGIALAGANQRQSGGDEDGILTALEAAGLNLWGTKLAVLSACETGVGEIKNGEGVYGLRRALVLAGAESQVMSLWKVDVRSNARPDGGVLQAATGRRGKNRSVAGGESYPV